MRILIAIAAVALAGCGVLPTIVPDMERRAARAQIEGARGPLSAQQSRNVLAGLKSRGEETSIFDRHLALEEEISGSPLVVGNRVALLVDGPAAFQAMFEATAAPGTTCISRPTSSRTTRLAGNSPRRFCRRRRAACR